MSEVVLNSFACQHIMNVEHWKSGYQISKKDENAARACEGYKAALEAGDSNNVCFCLAEGQELVVLE